MSWVQTINFGAEPTAEALTCGAELLSGAAWSAHFIRLQVTVADINLIIVKWTEQATSSESDPERCGCVMRLVDSSFRERLNRVLLECWIVGRRYLRSFGVSTANDGTDWDNFPTRVQTLLVMADTDIHPRRVTQISLWDPSAITSPGSTPSPITCSPVHTHSFIRCQLGHMTSGWRHPLICLSSQMFLAVNCDVFVEYEMRTHQDNSRPGFNNTVQFLRRGRK